jgi:hypothetical protein
MALGVKETTVDQERSPPDRKALREEILGILDSLF